MVQLIYKYLILNHEVQIPGVGILSFSRQPATYDFNNKTFIPPITKFVFVEGAAAAGGSFYSFISREQEIEEAEAIRKFDHFLKTLTTRLSKNERVHLPGVGILFKNDKDALLFEPAQLTPQYFPIVKVNRGVLPVAATIREANEGQSSAVAEVHVSPGGEALLSPKKTNWWKYAIILAVIAIAAIIYYYIKNGSLR
jgi:hypothetical protein